MKTFLLLILIVSVVFISGCSDNDIFVQEHDFCLNHGGTVLDKYSTHCGFLVNDTLVRSCYVALNQESQATMFFYYCRDE